MKRSLLSLCCLAVLGWTDPVWAEIQPLYFKDGESSASVDAWPGIAGGGWETEWQRFGNKLVAYRIRTASDQPLAAEHPTYLNVTLTKPASSASNQQQRLYRKYNLAEVPGNHTISLLFRLNSAEGDLDRIIVADVDSMEQDAKISWLARIQGGVWRVHDRNKTKDTGVTVLAGHVYRLTVEVASEKYKVTIEDLTNSTSYTSPELTFRNSDKVNGILAFYLIPKTPAEGESVLDCSIGGIEIKAQ